MPDGSRAQYSRSWTGVGVHPTPAELVRGFARAVSASVARRHKAGADVKVLDACAGDGRLGHAVAKRLSRLGFRPHLTLIEVDAHRLSDRVTSYEVARVVGDFYAFHFPAAFDVVVSNPPYLALGRVEADRLGLEWAHVVDCGRNLYGLALAKCLSVCKAAGVVGLLAPYGWLRNWRGDGLRTLINSRVQLVDIHASTSRRLFPSVHQDVAAQVFELRRARIERAAATVRIAYDHSNFNHVEMSKRPLSNQQFGARVRTGPFVWNRQKEFLSERAVGLPVVYGGNITSDGEVDFTIGRYKGRQFVAKTRVPQGYVSRGCCLVIKRSLRGVPGDWKLDAAILNGEYPFVAENHVIVIEFSGDFDSETIATTCGKIVRLVEREHRHHGHPNVSVAIVRRALEECWSTQNI